MKFRCKKDCFLEWTAKKTFTAGKEYQIVKYVVTDDNGGLRYIAEPGHKFFDEHFEIVDG